MHIDLNDAIELARKLTNGRCESSYVESEFRKLPQVNVDGLIDVIEEICSEIRERNVDDSVCGLCEYDTDHGIDGYANECPGFERNDCFKLKKEFRSEWIHSDGKEN